MLVTAMFIKTVNKHRSHLDAVISEINIIVAIIFCYYENRKLRESDFCKRKISIFVIYLKIKSIK